MENSAITFDELSDSFQAIIDARAEAERKAFDNLGRYKFSNFGYWSSAWVKFNALLPKQHKSPSPFTALVKLARE